MAATANTVTVSIIMPTFNRAKYILETVESIRQQTYSNWELVIVDDGSDDNTESLISGLNEERIIFHKAGRTGIGGKIKNIGLGIAKGELIAFVDSDDLWSPLKLEKQVAALEQYPEAGFCCTNGYNFKNPGEPVQYFYKATEGIRYDNFFLAYFRSELAGFTQALLFRKHCLDRTGLFKEAKSFSDIDFIVKLAYYFKGVILYEPLVYRRLHEESFIQSGTWIRSYHEGIDLIHEYANQKLLPAASAKDALFRLYINFGEKYLVYKQRTRSIGQFVKAWKNKPLSIVPLKKIGKAIFTTFSPQRTTE